MGWYTVWVVGMLDEWVGTVGGLIGTLGEGYVHWGTLGGWVRTLGGWVFALDECVGTLVLWVGTSVGWVHTMGCTG